MVKFVRLILAVSTLLLAAQADALVGYVAYPDYVGNPTTEAGAEAVWVGRCTPQPSATWTKDVYLTLFWSPLYDCKGYIYIPALCYFPGATNPITSPDFSHPNAVCGTPGNPTYDVYLYGTDGDGGNPGACKVCDGTNPINSGWRGNKYQWEVDYVGAGPFPLRVERHYNSREPQISGLTTSGANDIVGAWRHTYQRSIVVYSTGAKAAVYRPDGKIRIFNQSGAAWVTYANVTERLTQITGGWQYSTDNDDTETYDAAGKLTSIRNRAGLIQTLAYDGSNRLASVSDPFGRTLLFTYDASNRLSTVQDPANGIFTYGYDANGNLSSVTYPDTKVRTYVYENATYLKALTGIIDENANRYATWVYNAQGRATSSEHGATGSGIDRATVYYRVDGGADVTDALGTLRTYGYTIQFGLMQNTGASQACVTCGGNSAASINYDANGFVSSKIDFNGNQTNYVYNTNGLEVSRTEAANAALARTVTTTWHPTFRVPTQIDEPGRRTNLTYDAVGNLTQKTTTDTNTNAVRAWTYTYNGNGQVLTVDGPRTDVADVTTYAYDASGNVASVTNALNHVTNITSYDVHGRPLSMTDPNGLVTTLGYDARGRIISRNVGGEITGYTYDGVGQLTRVTLPNGAYLQYTYDAAHRLTQIQDQLGNRIAYTLDKLGNRTAENIYDPSNVLRQTRTRVFDSLSRLQKDIGGASPSTQITQYAYDNNNNLRTITDPLNHVTTNGYDALNRLIQLTDPGNGITRYGYTPLDQLASVTDPRNLVTGYTQDGLNNVTQTQSPDTGTTANTYDAAGNVVTRTDAKNQTTTYQYDVLNRVTLETRQGGTAVTYTYDGGTNQKGRLTGITDPSGSTTFAYDIKGRLTQKSQVIGSVTRTTKYAYDASGQLTRLTTPANKAINYVWTNGQISGVTLGTTSPTTIASAISYQPFGPAKTWTFGNNQVITRSFDLDGRMTGNAVESAVTYDAASRITGLTGIFPGRTYGYDALDRLVSFTDPTGNGSYSYDATGNRTQSVVGTVTNNYSINTASNRINSITVGASTLTYVHDADGSITSDGTYSFTYDTVGRLTQAKQGATLKGTYTLNGLGQRVKKVAGSAITLFTYDESGHLIGEYNGSGGLVQETVWLGDTPIATIRGSTTYYVHADHLNAPRKVVDQAQAIRWQWDYASFGSGAANGNPGGLGAFTYNLRFPGQYFDSETGLHYNTFRDYNPQTGRYVESDPIGLAGGINPYLYSYGNPLTWSDPLGLAPRTLDPNGQECKDLAKKIQNIRDNLEKRGTDIMFNQGNLPLTPPAPGAPNRASVLGHQKIIDDLKEVLQRRVKEYAEKCGGCGSPDCPGGNSAASSSSSGVSTAAQVGITGAACVAICILQPELCVPALLIGGAAAR